MTMAWIAPTPECPVHGQMKSRTGSASGYTATAWACPGWDGEGCDYQAPPPQWSEISFAEGRALIFGAPVSDRSENLP